MFSTRDRQPVRPTRRSPRLAAASVVLIALAGCLKTTNPPQPISRVPLVIDEAMQRRDWQPVAVHYQNGQTPAWPTGFILTHTPDAPKWAPAVTDGPLFMANVFAMPIGYAFTPAWTTVISTNEATPPTYNAMPPLPPK
jgi:hypothetical protein